MSTISPNRKKNKLAVGRNKARIWTISRDSHYSIDTLILLHRNIY